MADELLSGLFPDIDVKVVIATAAGVAREARQRHQLHATAAELLAEALCAGALMASLQKEKTRLNLQLECDGLLRGLFVDAESQGAVRGYVKNPFVEVQGEKGPFRWRPALGNSGYLSVLRDLGNGEFYRSSVELQAFDLGADLTRFFQTSEQVATELVLAVAPTSGEPLGAAAGVLLQALPSGDKDALRALAAELKGPAGLEAKLAAEPQSTAAHLGQRLFAGRALDVLSRWPLEFKCNCSREKVVGALATLTQADLTEMLEKDGKAEATCQFCAARYEVGPEELRRLADAARQ